jgi:hypothetical protein
VNLSTLVPLIVLVLLAERALHAPAPWPWVFWFLIGVVVVLEVTAVLRNVAAWFAGRRPPSQ